MRSVVKEKIGELVGSATMCWSNISKAGIFDSKGCGLVLDQIYSTIEDEYEDKTCTKDEYESTCTGSEDEYPYVKVKQLRKGLQRFNEDLGQYINSDQRYKLGRVLTIIDASISDPEQRKAIKDLVNNEWWSNGSRVTSENDRMTNPHTDMRGLCLALGFELYESKGNDALPVTVNDYEEWSAKSYRQTIKEE